MTDLEILTQGRELLSDPRRFTQGWFAKDGDGVICPAKDPRACSFCSYGALRHFSDTFKAPASLLRASRRVLSENNVTQSDKDSIVYVNDDLGYEATLKMWAYAIEEASGQTNVCDAA